MISVKFYYVGSTEVELGQLFVPVLCAQVLGKSPRVLPFLNLLPCPLAGWVNQYTANTQVSFRPVSIPVAV